MIRNFIGASLALVALLSGPQRMTPEPPIRISEFALVSGGNRKRRRALASIRRSRKVPGRRRF